MWRPAVAAFAALVSVAACSAQPPDGAVRIQAPMPVGPPAQPPEPFVVGVRPGPSPMMRGTVMPTRAMAQPKPRPKCKFPLTWRAAHRVPLAGGGSRHVPAGCY